MKEEVKWYKEELAFDEASYKEIEKQFRYNRGIMHSTLQKRHSLAGLFAGLAAASIWGGMYVVSKVVLEVVPPFALLTARYILGAATLAGVIYFRNKKSGTKYVLTKEFFRKSALVGFVGYGISLGFQFVGTKLSTASNGSLVTCATPAFVLLFAPFLLGERATTRSIIALIVSMLGVVAVIDPRNAELSPTLFWGNISLLAAALTWALYSVLVRKVSKSGDLLDLAVPLLFALALVHTAVYLLRHAFAPSGLLRSWERFIAWSVWKPLPSGSVDGSISVRIRWRW